MILKAIISFLIFVTEGLAKIIMFLMTALGLWIPALYSLLFVIVCAVTQTSFTEVLGLFYAGLAVSFLFSIAIAAYQVFKAKNSKRAEKNNAGSSIAKVTKKQGLAEKKKEKNEVAEQLAPYNDEYPDSYHMQQGYPVRQSQPPYPPQNYGQYAPQGYAQPQNPQYGQGYNAPQGYGRDYNGGMKPAASDYGAEPQSMGAYQQAKASMENTNFADYNSPGRSSQPGARGNNSEFGGYNNITAGYEAPQSGYGMTSPAMQEQPRIFRTRRDANMLIYEYSDRLVFYRTTPSGEMRLDHTEMKEPFGRQ